MVNKTPISIANFNILFYDADFFFVETVPFVVLLSTVCIVCVKLFWIK